MDIVTNSREIYTCPGCNGDYVINRDTFFGPDRKPYCEESCCFGDSFKKKPVKECVCPVCNKQFTMKAELFISKQKQHLNVCCSEDCENKRLSKRLIKCTCCGKNKLFIPSEYKKINKDKYCCVDCVRLGVKKEEKVVREKKFSCGLCSSMVVFSGGHLTVLENELRNNPKKMIVCSNCRSKYKSVKNNVIKNNKDLRKDCLFCGNKVPLERKDSFCREVCKTLGGFR